jgi:transcriptional regulator GlxA family with amidase domain
VSPDTELLHFEIVNLILSNTSSRLAIDNLVLDLIQTVFGKITDYNPTFGINKRTKKNHLSTIEKAKAYISENFTRNISLTELADHCCVSMLHFSRLFKTLTSFSPHQFLLNIRLKKAELLLKDTSMPVTDVAFSSGFNNIEHFSAAFRNKYNQPPSTYRIEGWKNSARFRK